MATQLLDSAPAEAPPADRPGAGGEDRPAATPAQPGETRCAKCGAPLAEGQDWCLQCGTGAPGSVSSGRWRGPAVIVALTLLLVLAAAAAGYAALSRPTRHAAVVTATVAQAPPPATTTTPAVTTPAPPPVSLNTKPPKIPLKAVTPIPAPTTPAVTPTTPAKTKTGTGTTTGSSGSGSGEKAAEPTSEAILLDTDAASTYNPYNYPAEWFGDPSLAIDNDPTTGWSAEVNPATAPSMAEGLAIDLKSVRHLATVKLVTGTPGITVQVYGTAAKAMPASITDPAWVPLSHSTVVAKRHAKINLRDRKRSFRFVTLWISKAPESAAGTPEAPGKISVDELELIPTH